MKADRFVLGLFVVIIGGAWLLVNLGLMPLWSLRDLWRYWPLLLVIWGLLLLFGKGNGGASGCLFTIVILLLIFGGFFSFVTPNFRVTGQTINTDISNIYNAETIRLELEQHAGEFRMSSHGDDQLLKLHLKTTEEPTVRHTQNGEVAEIKIVDETEHIPIGDRISSWNLSLPEDIPADIIMRTGALDADIDMTDLLVKSLDIKMGAGDLTMKLGQTDGTIKIQSGASSITIYIPDNVGVRLHTSGALLSVNSENGRVVSIGERRYESREIGAKDAVVDIEITAAAGSVTLRNFNP